MSERNKILTLVAVTFVIALASTQIRSLFDWEGDAEITDYTAVFRADGTLEETFTYKINVEGKQFLYRYWEDDLLNEEVDFPHIELLGIQVPDGSVGYMVDAYGTFYSSEEVDSYTSSFIKDKAYYSEAGAFSASGYEPGEYTVQFIFKLVPSLEYDDDYAHMNIKLASNHTAYQNVRVEVEDTGLIEKVYSHPPTLKQSTDGSTIVFTGSSGEDELLEFEFLLAPDAVNQMDGYPRLVEDVIGQTERANKNLQNQFTLANGMLWFNRVSIFLVPVGFYLLWQRYGKEREYVVPPFLSTVPNESRKPWIVNLVFKKDATDFDEDGFNATMLDLHERGKIKVKNVGEGVEIEILNKDGLDKYEQKVMDFLQETSKDNIIKTAYMESMVEQAQENEFVELKVLSLKNQYSQLVSGADNNVASDYTVNGRAKLIPFFLFSFLVIFAPIALLFSNFSAAFIFLSAAGVGFVTLVQSIVALIFPTTLFGYWKDDMYHEKLQWDAFKNHLSDFSQLEKYSTDDLSMWGKWLVYGTSLGVGDKVAEAMESLKVDYPSRHLVHSYGYWFRPIYTATTPKTRSSGSSSGGGGGGFGGGGGMGGGGGGVR